MGRERAGNTVEGRKKDWWRRGYGGKIEWWGEGGEGERKVSETKQRECWR